MSNAIYFVLEHEEYGLDWDHAENFFFLNELEAKQYEEQLKTDTTCNHSFNIRKITFEELKELATVAEFEELFSIVIEEPVAKTKIGGVL